MTFPETQRDVEVGIFIDGRWVDATLDGGGVRSSQGIALNYGRGNWAGDVDPATAQMTLDNRDGRWSPDNAAGAYAGNLRRNLPVRVGVGHGDRHLAPTDLSSDVASTPDTAALDITGDIDLRVEFQLNQDLVDSVEFGGRRARLASKGDGLDGWELGLFENSSGAVVVQFQWWEAGFAQNSYETELGWAAQHDRMALAFTLDSASGTGQFFTAAGINQTYTAVGSADNSAGATDISATSEPLRVGGSAFDFSDFQPFPGRIYALQLRDGINGTLVASPDFTAQASGATSFTDSAGRVWTVGDGGRITDMNWRYHGELSSLPVRWNIDGSDVTAPITATGIFRRLQRSRTIESPLRRAVTRSLADYVQYWPCEESARTLTQFGAAIGTAAMAITNTPTPAASSEFNGSDPLPTLGSDIWTAVVDSYSGTDWQIRWLMAVPDGFTGTDVRILFIETSGYDWEIQYRADGGGQMRYVAYNGATAVHTSGWISFDATGAARRYTFSVEQNGGNVDVQFLGQAENEPSAGGVNDPSVVAGSAGTVDVIRVNSTEDASGWTFGHITLQSDLSSSSELADGLNAYVGETAANRIKRLCREEGIRHRIYGDPDDTEIMGPQQSGTLLSVLRDCANTDIGILHEAVDDRAVAYRTRASMLGQTAAVTLNYSLGELAASPALDRDDQGVYNDVTVENWNGATARALLDNGTAMSVTEPPVGIGAGYDRSYQVNSLDSRLPSIAAFVLGVTSVDEPRVSQLSAAFELPAMTDVLERDLLDLRLGDKIDVINVLPAALDTAPISQLAQGGRETILPYQHRLDLLTSPSSPWVSSPEAITLDVAATTTDDGSGALTLSNPVQNTGNSLIAVAVGPGPANEGSGSGSWVAPPGGTVIFDYGGESFAPRVRAWFIQDEAGAANYTFGWATGVAEGGTCALMGLNGRALSATATATPTVVGGSTSSPYPPLATAINDLVVAVAVGQVNDTLTSGPGAFTQAYNLMPGVERHTQAAHVANATGTTTDPGNSSWDGSSGAHIQFCIGVAAAGASGGANARIPNAEWTVYIDPEDPSTYDETRTDGQLIAIGNRWNTGDVTDGVNAGTGYGFSFDTVAADEIHSFEMEDGDTLRLGARPVSGLFNIAKALLAKHQWRNGNGYDESQETPAGVNLSTEFPGTDRTYFDGTRTQYAQIPTSAADPKAIAASYNQGDGDIVIAADVFRVENWWLAADDNAGTELHAPATSGPLSPYIEFIGDGAFKIDTRDQVAAWGSGDPAPPGTNRFTQLVSGSDVGNWWGIVRRFRLDPVQGFLEVYLNTGSGFIQVINITGGWGWAHADGVADNAIFYWMMGPRFYSWHRYTNDPVNAPNNWDPTFGNVRTMANAGSGLMVAATKTAAEVISHCNHFLEG